MAADFIFPPDGFAVWRAGLRWPRTGDRKVARTRRQECPRYSFMEHTIWPKAVRE